jgi:hypothetical protein
MAGISIARRHLVLTMAAVVIAGCGGPAGGTRRPARPPRRGETAFAPGGDDGTMLMPSLRLVAAEPGRQGVILRAEAVAPTLGFHSPELRPVGRDPAGTEILEFRARPPAVPEPVGAERARLLVAARFYRPHELREIRAFRVVARENSAESRLP